MDAEVTWLSTPDALALKLHQLEQSLRHKAGADLASYVQSWIGATRDVLTDRFGELRDFSA